MKYNTRNILKTVNVCTIGLSAGMGMLPSSLQGGELSEPRKQPNVVFVLSDNQSYYEMSCHGHEKIDTPNIDRLAEQGVDFQRFYAPPYCSPSRSAMLTGKHAMRSGIHNTVGGRHIMHRSETTLAEMLKDNGYSTGIFGKWHLGESYPYGPEHRGFDEVLIHGGGGVGQLPDYYGNSL